MKSVEQQIEEFICKIKKNDFQFKLDLSQRFANVIEDSPIFTELKDLFPSVTWSFQENKIKYKAAIRVQKQVESKLKQLMKISKIEKSISPWDAWIIKCQTDQRYYFQRRKFEFNGKAILQLCENQQDQPIEQKVIIEGFSEYLPEVTKQLEQFCQDQKALKNYTELKLSIQEKNLVLQQILENFKSSSFRQQKYRKLKFIEAENGVIIYGRQSHRNVFKRDADSFIQLSKMPKRVISNSLKPNQLTFLQNNLCEIRLIAKKFQAHLLQENDLVLIKGNSHLAQCQAEIKNYIYQELHHITYEMQNPGIFNKQLQTLCKLYKVNLIPGQLSSIEFFYQVNKGDLNYDQTQHTELNFVRYNSDSRLKLDQKWHEFQNSEESKKQFVLTVGTSVYQIEFNNKIQGEGLVGVQTNKTTLKSRVIKKSIEENKGQDKTKIRGAVRKIEQVKKLWDQSFKFRLRGPLKLQLFQFHKARLIKQLNLEDISAQLNQFGDVISIHIKGPQRVRAKEAFVSLYYESKSFPSYWEEFKQKLRIVQLEPGSQKYQEVENTFKKTMSDAKILKIQMVMHKDKFNDFQYRIESLQQEGYPGLTMRLFHGSRDIPAEKLIQNNEGLDPQFSNDSGMWGRAVYFAQNASYSDAYAYQLQGGLKEMLYCEVYIGRYCQMKSDRSLRNPPDGYTSVKGNTNGSDVYMVYKNDRSYIDCVITYTHNSKANYFMVGQGEVLKETSKYYGSAEKIQKNFNDSD